MVQITFLGAAGTVTGSKYLVEHANQRLLIDSGIFQGDREWREKNWDVPAVELSSVNAVLLTHAHIDHTGMLPRFRKLGLKCPIYCSKPTLELSKLLLLDSAHLQEEEAEYRESRGRSRHHPALPLYTVKDAESVLELFRAIRVHDRVEVLPGIFAEWRRAGHIIGACNIRLEIGGKIINFSGDIGRYNVPILADPEPVTFGDLLLVESTYGDRSHGSQSPTAQLEKVINATVKRGGIVLIPSFAVGRTQTLLFYIRELKSKNLIPDIPVVIDSPMASDATEIYARNPQDYDEESLGILKEGSKPFYTSKLGFAKSRLDSIKLNGVDEPMILISASGMMTGGRILHHLRNRISDPRNTLLFVGYQPPGSRGAWIKAGNPMVRIFGQEYEVRLQTEEISGLSAHGDKDELLRWCKSCTGKPGKVAVVHGEPESAKIFSHTLQTECGFDAFVAAYLQKIDV